MNKIQTDRQMKGGMLIACIAASTVCGVAVSHAAGTPLYQLAWICCLFDFLILFISAINWGLRNQIDLGVKYAWKHYILVLQLRKQLLEAGIYVTRKIGAAKIAVLPWVVVKYAPDYKSGKIYIKNSVKFHDRLNRMNISAALGAYVTEQVYLTDDGNYYYFDFYDSSINRRKIFNSLEEFRKYSDALGKYELGIDNYTTVLLTHQLTAGQTGSGKSYALLGLLLQMMLKPIKYHIYFADPKASSIALLGARLSPETTADTYDGIVALLEDFVRKMEERQSEMKEHLIKKIDGDYRDFNLSPYVLIFDEYAAFSLLLEERDKKQRDHVKSLISQIVLKGRQSGFFIWLVMQQAGSNNIPTYLRDNLPWKTVLGNAEDQTYVTAFGPGVEIPERKMAVGEGVFTYPSIANKPKLCSFPTLRFDVLEALDGAGVM